MKPVPDAENTGDQCQTGEKLTGARRGKTCSQCHKRKIMQPLPNRVNTVTDFKRGKTCNQCNICKR